MDFYVDGQLLYTSYEHIPTHASRAQYQQATALEALLGWLHLSGRHDRVEQLFAVMMEEE